MRTVTLLSVIVIIPTMAFFLAWAPEAQAELSDDIKKECEKAAGLGQPSQDGDPARDIVVDCQDPAVKEKLKGLIGRLRETKNSADLFRREFTVAQCMRDKARDRFWGGRGSFAKYLNSLLGMATISSSFGGRGLPKGLPPGRLALNHAAGWANTAIDVLQSPGDFTTWAGGGAQVVGTDTVSQAWALMQWGIEFDHVNAEADAYFKATGDADGAARMFQNMEIPSDIAKDLKTGADVVGAAVSVIDCVQATTEVTNDSLAYFEWKREAKQAKAELDKIDDQIEELLKEISNLREQCKPCPDGFTRDATFQCKNPCGADFRCPPGRYCVGQCR